MKSPVPDHAADALAAAITFLHHGEPMINSITGILTFRTAEQVGLENGGMEWAIETTATTLSALPGRGEQVRIYTYLHHTQDQMKMYGFGTVEERSSFLALLSVNGVGPSLARKILSGTTSGPVSGGC